METEVRALKLWSTDQLLAAKTQILAELVRPGQKAMAYDMVAAIDIVLKQRSA